MNLTAALLSAERPLTARELRERVPGYPDEKASFRRAFERDKDDLREMGVPLVVEAVPGTDPIVDGYRIPKDEYYLRDPGLDPDELAALHLAARAVHFDSVSHAEALRKLGGVVDDPGEPGDLAALPNAPALASLFTALIEHRLVRFTYRGDERVVEPRRLDFQRGRWYLTGFDRLRDDERHFRLDRIEGEPATDDRDTAPPPVDSQATWRQPWELGDDHPVRARVLVDADQAGWVANELGEEVVAERRDDGSLVLEMGVSDEAAFRSFVLSFLDHGEVLDPPELRDMVVSWLRELSR